MYPFLLSQVLRGYWFLRPEEVISGQAIVNRLLTGEYSNDKFAHILSENTPIPQSTNTDSGTFDKAPKGSTAIIAIYGTLMKHGTFCSYGTDEIAEQIRLAAHHSNISSIVLDIDSGGGACDAVAPIVTAIKNTQSTGCPVIACCDLAASAAYWIASACDRIVANNDISSAFGSIGVMCSFADAKPMYEKMGYKFHEIYADQSSNKNEDFQLALKGDYSLIKKESLNPLAASFQDAVKKNRKYLKAETPGILSGKMFFAKEALEAGLIDEIGSLSKAVEIARNLSADETINKYINS